MRLSISAIILAASALARADFFLAASETAEFSVGEPKAIQWNTSDFEGNIDLFVGPEDADEDDENAGIKIATDYPNSGSFSYTPTDDFDIATSGKKKKKVWGHDKKKKNGKKGKKLIIIIILPPGYKPKEPKEPYKPEDPKHPGKPKEPIEKPTIVLPPVILPTVVLPPVILPTVIAPPIKTPVTLPPVILPTVVVPPIEKPTVVLPPITLPTVIAPPIQTPTITKVFPSIPTRTGGTILPTGTGGGDSGGGGGGGTSPPIFTGAASAYTAKPFLAGGFMGLLAIGMF